MFTDLTVSILGGIGTAGVLYAFARLLELVGPPSRPASKVARLVRSIVMRPSATVPSPAGSFLRAPRKAIVGIACVLAGLMVVVDVYHSPLGVPHPNALREGDEVGDRLNAEADEALRRARDERDETLRDAQQNAGQVLWEAEVARASASSRSVVSEARTKLAATEAERILSNAHREAARGIEAAQVRAASLRARADSGLATWHGSSQTAWYSLRGLFAWPLRVLVLLTFAGYARRAWSAGASTREALLPSAAVALLLAAITLPQAMQGIPLVFLIPAWVASASAVAGSHSLRSSPLALSAVSFMYQRFGYFVATLLIVGVCLDGFSLLGSYIGRMGDAYLLRSIQEPNAAFLGEFSYLTDIGAWAGMHFGFEFGALMTVAIMTSVYLGKSDPQATGESADAAV